MGFKRRRREEETGVEQQTDTAKNGSTVPNNSSEQQATDSGTNSESQNFLDMPDDELLQELQTKPKGKSKKYGAAQKGRVRRSSRLQVKRRKRAISLRKRKTQ